MQRRADRPRRARDARARARPRGGRRRLAVRQGPLRLPARPHGRAARAAAGARGHAAAARELGEGAGRRERRAEEGGRRRRPRWPAARRPTRRRSCSRSCSARGSARATSARAPGGELPLDVTRALADPACRPRCPTSSSPTRCCCSTPTRSTTRRCGTCASARACAATACASAWSARGRPRSTPTPSSRCATRPGTGEALLVALDAALSGDKGNLGGAASTAGSNAGAVQRPGELPQGRRGPRDRLRRARCSGPGGAQAARALLNLASRLGLAGRAGAGLLEAPVHATRAALREAGFAPGHGPGYATLAEPGRDAAGIAAQLAERRALDRLAAPRRPAAHPSRPRRLGGSALDTAQTVIAVDSVLTDTIREHADVVFPAEAYAEKEGTLTHPDGRVQRLRPAIGRPRGARRPERLRRAPAVAGDRRRRRARPGWSSASAPARWPPSSSSTPCPSTPG